MKKVVLALGLVLLVAGAVWADPVNVPDLINKMPIVEQGIVYNLSEDAWQPITSVPVYKWKMLALSAGYVGPDKAAVAMSIDLLDFSDFTTMPILEWVSIKPCYFYSMDRLFDHGKSDDSHGFGTSILDIRF
jgi:hypothetical protein